jgi:hypothetical protein
LIHDRLHWSEEIYRIFEMDPARFDASYEAFLELVHPDDRARVNRVYTESVRDRTPYDMEHRLLLPDGRVKFVHEQCRTVYDAEGRALRSLGTVQDITARKCVEEDIRKLNQELDQRVKERTVELEAKNMELERMNKLFVGRELRMVELKQRIGELEQQFRGTEPRSGT